MLRFEHVTRQKLKSFTWIHHLALGNIIVLAGMRLSLILKIVSKVFMETTALLYGVEVRFAYILPSLDPISEWDILGSFGLA